MGSRQYGLATKIGKVDAHSSLRELCDSNLRPISPPRWRGLAVSACSFPKRALARTGSPLSRGTSTSASGAPGGAHRELSAPNGVCVVSLFFVCLDNLILTVDVHHPELRCAYPGVGEDAVRVVRVVIVVDDLELFAAPSAGPDRSSASADDGLPARPYDAA